MATEEVVDTAASHALPSTSQDATRAFRPGHRIFP